jgi:hypothetical protein
MAARIFGRDASGEVEPRHVDAANVALRELAWWARALRAARAEGVPPDR